MADHGKAQERALLAVPSNGASSTDHHIEGGLLGSPASYPEELAGVSRMALRAYDAHLRGVPSCCRDG